jgi:hypothetical protein
MMRCAYGHHDIHYNGHRKELVRIQDAVGMQLLQASNIFE